MDRSLFLFFLPLLLLGAGCSGTTHVQQSPPATSQEADPPIQLYEKALGAFSRSVTTSSKEAQAFVDQGFQMMYAFASNDAPRSFREAQRKDSLCAMCFWGEAWTRGPYLNAPMFKENAKSAYEAAHRALRLARDHATPAEQAMIEAMVTRYEPVHDPDNRSRLDSVYASAMEEVFKAHPNDLDVGTLYAEALMLLEPRRGNWDLNKAEVQQIHKVLEHVLARDIKHPGACHLYIHATESTTRPDKAEACAEFIGNSIPGASHINHMPSHTWSRVGRWAEAVRANIQAWHSDQKASIGEGFAIYPSHNLHMLLFAASMDGQGAIAIQAGKDYGKLITGGIFYQVLALVRFGRFDEILALKNRPERPIFRGFWDFGKGYAHLKTGNPKKARDYLKRVEDTARDAPESASFRGHPAHRLLGVVGGILRGEMLHQEGEHKQAIEVLERAIMLEDSLRYDEPEPLNFSARHWLGAVLLETGQPAEAEQVYRAALMDHPNNGWSLLGLEQALRARGQHQEADAAHEAFKKAWGRSDTWIRSSRF